MFNDNNDNNDKGGLTPEQIEDFDELTLKADRCVVTAYTRGYGKVNEVYLTDLFDLRQPEKHSSSYEAFNNDIFNDLSNESWQEAIDECWDDALSYDKNYSIIHDYACDLLYDEIDTMSITISYKDVEILDITDECNVIFDSDASMIEYMILGLYCNINDIINKIEKNRSILKQIEQLETRINTLEKQIDIDYEYKSRQINEKDGGELFV